MIIFGWKKHEITVTYGGKTSFFRQIWTKFQGQIFKKCFFLAQKTFQIQPIPALLWPKKMTQKTIFKRNLKVYKRGGRGKSCDAKNGMYPGVDKNRLFWKVKKRAPFVKKRFLKVIFTIFPRVPFS